MPDIQFVEGKEGKREALCGHCGADAAWSFLDEEESRVEVVCPALRPVRNDARGVDQAEAEIALVPGEQ